MYKNRPQCKPRRDVLRLRLEHRLKPATTVAQLPFFQFSG